MKNLLFLVLILGISHNSIKAQAGLFNVHFSYGAAAVSSKDFRDFRSSYNRFLIGQPRIEKRLSRLNIGYSFSWGLAINCYPFPMLFEIDSYRQRQRATQTFTTGETRRFDFRRRGAGCLIAAGNMFIYGGVGFEVGQTLIESSFVYADGTVSFSDELALNGRYNRIALPIFFGLRGNIPLSGPFVLLRVKVDWFPGTRNVSDLGDYNDITKAFSENFPTITSIPVDFEAYAQNPVPTSRVETIDDSFSIFRLEFGLTYNFMHSK